MKVVFVTYINFVYDSSNKVLLPSDIISSFSLRYATMKRRHYFLVNNIFEYDTLLLIIMGVVFYLFTPTRTGK